MGFSTTSKGLIKPNNDNSTPADISQLNTNFDRIDGYGMGAYVCTSTTRPIGADRWVGMFIVETDTKFVRSYTVEGWSASLSIPTYTGATRPANPLVSDKITDGANIREWDGVRWRNVNPLVATISPKNPPASWSIANATWVGLSYMDQVDTNDTYEYATTAITPTGSNISTGIILAEDGYYRCGMFASPGGSIASGPVAIKIIACNPSGGIIADQLCYADKMANTQANGIVAQGGVRYLPAGTRLVPQVYQNSGAAISWPIGLIGTGAQTVITVEKDF